MGGTTLHAEKIKASSSFAVRSEKAALILMSMKIYNT
jgi:hypothetical protein